MKKENIFISIIVIVLILYFIPSLKLEKKQANGIYEAYEDPIAEAKPTCNLCNIDKQSEQNSNNWNCVGQCVQITQQISDCAVIKWANYGKIGYYMFLGSDFSCSDSQTTSNPLWQCYYNSQSACVPEQSPCSSHSVKKCFDNDLYWYDSCGNKEDFYKDCGVYQVLGNSCSNGNLYEDFRDNHCEASDCQTSTGKKLIELSSNQCKSNCNTLADTNCDNNICFDEILLYVQKWVSGTVIFDDALSAVQKWTIQSINC